MINYQITNYSFKTKLMTVSYTLAETNEKISVSLLVPRDQGQWLTGEDLEKYITFFYPPNQTLEHNSTVVNNLTVYTVIDYMGVSKQITEIEYQQILNDLNWIASVSNQSAPPGFPNEIIDRVIDFKKQNFLNFCSNNGEIGYSLFDQEGSFQWVVPPNEDFLRFYVKASGMPTWEQGPGGIFHNTARVTPGDVINITIGTQTTVTSSLGTISVGSGWESIAISQQEYNEISPWGHIGKPGCVLIY